LGSECQFADSPANRATSRFSRHEPAALELSNNDSRALGRGEDTSPSWSQRRPHAPQ